MEDFKREHLAGRISPKNIHKASPLIPTVTRLWDIGRQLQLDRVAGPYKVTFAVWYDMDALEGYQSNAVTECKKIGAL